jgi:hypothetical protein
LNTFDIPPDKEIKKVKPSVRHMSGFKPFKFVEKFNLEPLDEQSLDVDVEKIFQDIGHIFH